MILAVIETLPRRHAPAFVDPYPISAADLDKLRKAMLAEATLRSPGSGATFHGSK
jgi:hypothetical protein